LEALKWANQVTAQKVLAPTKYVIADAKLFLE
jgi:hypothetical protein